MRFADIKSQGSAIAVLRRAILSDRVPHAYMFGGPPGVGKFLAARALAMALNCKKGGDDSCGECLSCRKVMREIHPDVFVVTLKDKKKRIPVDSIRDLERRLSSRPHEGKAKVAIVDPADAMTESAANALLKTLEEPRQGAFIILISNRTASMLSTVHSRCQKVRFRSLPENTVADLLIESGCDAEQAAITAALSNGSMDAAAAYQDQDLESRFAASLGLLKGALLPTPNTGLAVAASVSGRRDEAIGILSLTLVLLSEILWIKNHGADEGPAPSHNPDETFQKGPLPGPMEGLHEGLAELALSMNTEQLALFVAQAHLASQRIVNNNMNPQLAVENMLMSMRGRTDCGLTGSGFGTE